MLLFETLFFILLSRPYTKTSSFYFDNDNVWSKHLWNWNFLCVFWKPTWATRCIQTKHAWTNGCWYPLRCKLPAGPLPSTVCGQWQEWKKQNENTKMNKLAKLKTRKGSLGKNEHPDGLTTFKGSSGKNRGTWKEFIPRWVENPKGRSRQKWDDERKNEWKKKQTRKSIDHRCDV